MLPNIWIAAKAVLRNFLVIYAYISKQEKSEVNNPTSHLKEPEKEQMKPQVSRRNEIINIRVKITRNLKKVEINETRSWSFEKINKNGNQLARFIFKNREIKSK